MAVGRGVDKPQEIEPRQHGGIQVGAADRAVHPLLKGCDATLGGGVDFFQPTVLNGFRNGGVAVAY